MDDKLGMLLFKFCTDKISTVVFFPALERPEGASPQDCVDMEEFQQRINAVSLEKVKAYYRRLRYTASKFLNGIPTTQDIFHSGEWCPHAFVAQSHVKIS